MTAGGKLTFAWAAFDASAALDFGFPTPCQQSGRADAAALGEGGLGAAESGAGLGTLGGLGAVSRTGVSAIVGAGADDDAQVVAVHHAVAVDVTVEPAVGRGACAVVAQADDDADV